MSNISGAINVQIDPIDKEDAQKILKALGINMTSYINMAIKQLIYHEGLPFEVRTPRPNKELIEAIHEGEKLLKEMKHDKELGYNNMADLINSLNEE